jgi:hypothetical protein
MHPECNPYEFFGASNLHRGEALLAEVYNAIRNGPTGKALFSSFCSTNMAAVTTTFHHPRPIQTAP